MKFNVDYCKSLSDDCRTPSFLYNWFVNECGYFDPCPFQCKEFDGLKIEWPKNVFCNPPYSEISKWVDKAIMEHHRQFDSDIVLLVPARTDTKWFHKLIANANRITFIKGRLHFNDSKLAAPFPNLLVNLYYCHDETSAECSDLSYYKEWYSEEGGSL